MRVISKLASVDFEFGEVNREGNLLAIESHADSKMKSTVYVSPQDAVALFKRIVVSPSAMFFILGLPYFLFRWHRSKKQISNNSNRVKEWPKV